MAAAAAAPRMGGSAHSSSSISPPAPSWHPVVLVPISHQQQHQVLYDPDLATPSPSPTTPAAAATASPPRHSHLRPASRRAGKQRRRPRPSRKLPTTYISADAASFRRMVHQVTGADDALLMLPGPAAPGVICRPVSATAAPSRGAGLTTTTTTTETLLPTLDTSAFLMLGAAGGGGGGPAPARPGVSCCYHSSAAAAVDPGAAALQVNAEARGGGGEFPSPESWDEDDALF